MPVPERTEATTMANDTKLSLARLALVGGAALLAAATVAGCQSSRDSAHADDAAARHGEQFPRDTDPRPLDAFTAVQTANGARADATLNADHFDIRGGLNSLGRRKLELMLRADEPGPLVVWLDGSRANAAARAAGVEAVSFDVWRQSVTAYLGDRGVDASHVELRSGANVTRTHPARQDIAALKEMRTGDKATSDSATESNPRPLSANDLMTGSGTK